MEDDEGRDSEAGDEDSPGVRDLVLRLTSHDPAIRDDAALKLRDLRANEAVEPLFRAIATPSTANHRGTLAYALIPFDCSQHFPQLFDMALNGSYEVQCHSLTILEEQEMSVTPSDLNFAAAKLDAVFSGDRMAEVDAELLHDELMAVLAKLRKAIDTQ